ncbi:MAG: DEAD/DEAH box helicase family protein [Chitinophagaceae bacterium]
MNSRIKSNFLGWDVVAENLERICSESKTDQWLNKGQQDSIRAVAKHISNNGMIIADEVGMGKTRIAVAIAKAVTEAKGRVAILIPAGLGYQWQEELRSGKISDFPDTIRSLNNYFDEKNSRLFSRQLLLVSHLFSNWQHRENSKNSRFSLLPEMCAYLRKEQKRMPRNYQNWSCQYSSVANETKAKEIIEAIPKNKANPARKKLTELTDLEWTESLFFSNSYTESGGEKLRKHFKTCIGLGFGVFDLIIVDEAHKNRGTDSGLSKLLDNIICRNPEHRVIGLTATPVELELEDWLSSLKRIGVDIESSAIKEDISKYADAVRQVRISWKFSEPDRNLFKLTSLSFKNSLKKYIIRRNKREDAAVEMFKGKTGLSNYQYRSEKEVLVDPLDQAFPDSWKRILCAAEALSFCSSIKDDTFSKRIRLTLGSGHGINELLDNFLFEENMDQPIDKSQDKNDISPEFVNKVHSQKRQERSAYWVQSIFNSIGQKKENLFQHPAILEAIKCIEEEYTQHNSKVLVFGKFTKPMEALVALLNAREMIRRLDKGSFWPQIQISRSEVTVINTALNQLRGSTKSRWDVGKINKTLKRNENKREYSRRKFRKGFFANLETGFSKNNNTIYSFSFRVMQNLKEKSAAGNKKAIKVFNLLTRACHELYFGTETLTIDEVGDPVFLYEKYHELLLSITDDDKGDESENELYDKDSIGDVLEMLNERLREEFGNQTPKFARFMYGQTLQHSRRLMQSAFNRKDSFPYVLVAQSKVGREGLNLHKACKTIVMLHPEWNPSVAEQQVGRVDRLGSLWSSMIGDYSGNGEAIPRIEIRPVIFKYTYDEEHWRVLKERWDDLRAQLHGIIIPDRLAADASSAEKDIINDLNRHAPDFSPLSTGTII